MLIDVAKLLSNAAKLNSLYIVSIVAMLIINMSMFINIDTGKTPPINSEYVAKMILPVKIISFDSLLFFNGPEINTIAMLNNSGITIPTAISFDINLDLLRISIKNIKNIPEDTDATNIATVFVLLNIKYINTVPNKMVCVNPSINIDALKLTIYTPTNAHEIVLMINNDNTAISKIAYLQINFLPFLCLNL